MRNRPLPDHPCDAPIEFAKKVIAGGERRTLVTEVYTAVETTIVSSGQRRQEFEAE